MDQFFFLSLKKFADRYPCPLGYDVRNVVSVHFLFEHTGAILLKLLYTVLLLFQFLFKLWDFSIEDLSYLVQVTLPLESFCVDPELVYTFLDITDFLNNSLFLLPAGLERIALLFEVGKILFDFL